MLFSDSFPPDPFKRFLLFLILFLITPFLVFAKQPLENQEILSKVLDHLKTHYFRPLTSEELQAKSQDELFSQLDQDTRLDAVRPSTLDFVRGLRKEKSIAEAKRLQQGVGYIQVSFLGRRTTRDFDKVLNQFIRDGVQDLILDLRGNSGGSLESGVALAEHFVPPGKLLFTFQGREGLETKYYSQKKRTKSFKILVLLDHKTASTAEMIASVLRRYAHARLIGEPTYGKRSIQESFAVDPSHILFLTTGHFILPEDSQKKLQPDFEVPSRKALEKALSIVRKGKSRLLLTETETSVREGKAVQAAAAPQL